MSPGKKSRIAIFASGNGTNAEALLQYFHHHEGIEIGLVLSNNPAAFVLQRAKKFNVPSLTFTKDQFHQGVVLRWLEEYDITHVVLAGFLWLIPVTYVERFRGHMVNIHPSLLPKFSGKGMYGMNVHEAVKNSGDAKTGITIHVVDEHYDRGEILFQGTCDIAPHETPQQIAAKVHELEYEHYPQVIERWITH